MGCMVKGVRCLCCCVFFGRAVCGWYTYDGSQWCSGCVVFFHFGYMRPGLCLPPPPPQERIHNGRTALGLGHASGWAQQVVY